jgi:hypothetical protein
MTTLESETVACAHCGTLNTVQVIASTNAFGSMDLDMRPPPGARHTLAQQIHQCSGCGFCSPDLAGAVGVDTAGVGSGAYLERLADAAFPPLARRFRAHALLAEAAGDPRRAAWALLRAAWACDDGGAAHAQGALACRLAALVALERVAAAAEVFTADAQTDAVLRLDLLRRCGRFHTVNEMAQRLQQEGLPDILACIAAYEMRLARAGDDRCHRVEDALPPDDAPPPPRRGAIARAMQRMRAALAGR